MQRVDIELPMPPGSVERIRQLNQALDRADDLCQQERLLTLASTPDMLAFRAWVLHQAISQIEHARAPMAYDGWCRLTPDGWCWRDRTVQRHLRGRVPKALRHAVTSRPASSSEPSSTGAQANRDSGNAAISANGSFVTINSGATNLIKGNTNAAPRSIHPRTP